MSQYGEHYLVTKFVFFFVVVENREWGVLIVQLNLDESICLWEFNFCDGDGLF